MMKNPQQFLNDCIAAYLAYARGCGFATNSLDATPALVKASMTVGSAIFKDANLQKAANDPIAFKRKVIGAIGSCVYAGIVFGCKFRKDPSLVTDAKLVAKIVDDGPMDMARDTLKRYFGFEQGAERSYITGLTDKWAEVCGEYLALAWQQRQGYIAASMIAAFRLGVTMVMDRSKIPDGSTFIFGDEPKSDVKPADGGGKLPVVLDKKPPQKDQPVEKPDSEIKKPDAGSDTQPKPVDGPEPTPVVRPPESQQQEEQKPIKVAIEVECRKFICLEMAQSRVPIIPRIVIFNCNMVDAPGLVCRISNPKGIFSETEISFSLVSTGSEHDIDNVILQCDAHYLQNVIDEERIVIRIDILREGEVLASKEYAIYAMPRRVDLGRRTAKPINENLSPRVAHWADRLMQLSAFNPLLNRAKSKCVIDLECSGDDIAEFEDHMSSAGGYYTFADWPAINKSNAEDEDRDFAKNNDGHLPPGARSRIIAAGFRNHSLCVAEKIGRNGKKRDRLNKRVRRRPQYVSALMRLEAYGMESAEETGAETLYASIGSLEWEYVDGKGKTEICRAPILLMPIELEISSGTGGCRVRKSSSDSDTILNQSLVKLLETKNVYFDDFTSGLPTDDSGLDVMKILRALDNRIFGRGNLKVIYDLCIGHFTFGNYAKWSDVHDHADMLEAHPLVKHLIERMGVYHDGIDLVTTDNINEYLDPTDLYCPKPMDSTQLTAVINSSRGKSFLLDGPPGTGKSHTITNIIAHNLAKGRRILFVAQKETALNVVKERLDKVGLAPFCLQLYAEQSDKAAVLQQFQDSIDVSLDHTPDEWKRCAEALKAYKGPLEEYVKVLHRSLGNGLTPYKCLQSFFQYGRSKYAQYIDADCCTESKEQIEARRMAIREFADTFRAVKADLEEIRKLPELKNARVSWAYDRDLCEACANADSAADRALKAVAELGDKWNVGGSPDTETVRNVVKMIEALLETGYSLERIPLPYYGLDATALREQLKADAEKSDKFSDLSGKIRGLESELVAFDLEKILTIACAERRREIERWDKKFIKGFGKSPLELLGDYRKDGEAFKTVGEAYSFLDKVSTYQEYKKASKEGGAPECGAVNGLTSDARANLQKHLVALKAFVSAVEKAEEFLSEDIFAQNSIPDVQSLLKHLIASERLIGKKISYSAERTKVESCKMGAFAQLVEDGVLAPERVATEFDRAFESKMLDRIMRDESNRALDGFRVVKHNSSIAHYKELLKKYQKAAKDATIARVAQGYPDLKTGRGLTMEENRMLGEISDYIVKPSNCRSIRQFLIDNAPLVERTKRCFLMTPSSVAQFLPMSVTPFDMVIFDEASQLETCDAVGVIARGKQVIVTGDPKQMPPYDKIGSTKSDESIEMDSVLDECKARGLPSVKLAWHYRSRHESLISFSNHKYYDDNLNTFPSVNESKSVGVQYRFVPEGVFYSPSKGQADADSDVRQVKGANIYEALKVVDYVIETAKSFEFQSDLRNDEEDPVIGVVAFNQTQQEVITRLLKGRAPAFLYQKRSDGKASESAGAVAADKCAKKPVAYFVKNIESVQGDEADVIVFSICYGPYQPRKQIENLKGSIEYKRFFPNGYGTLNTEGGEKRLNVAITRARVRMVVFASILSDEVAVADEKKKGPLHFREFLAVAERSGRRMLGDSVATPSEGLMKVVADTLTENGYEYVAMVGASKCKIDLAVCDKFDPHRFMLGIECDGPMYHDQPLVMDRDVSRTEVLKGAQWEMYRVWSVEWLQGCKDGFVDAKRRLLDKLAELTELSRKRRLNRWASICKCKDAEIKEIEDFTIGAQDKEDLLADVIEDMEESEEDA